MRTAAKMAVLALGIAAGSLVWAEHQDGHEHGGWFDTDACQICKPLSEPAGLLASMKWETHTIHDGMLMVAIVPEAQKKTYGEACAKMDKAVAKIAGGEKPESLCGFCESLGALMHAGAKMQKVKTSFGTITVVTSTEATTVKKIHAHAKRTQDETKKMFALVQ